MLFVGNLPWVLDSYGLRKLFEPFGEVLSAQIAHDDQNDRSLGYGHLIFAQDKSALLAIQEMDRRDIGGRSINVHFPRKVARVTAADSFDFDDYDDRRGRRGGRSRGIDARAMRYNPGAAGGSRYAQVQAARMLLLGPCRADRV
jgi:RNA recognition motif-containing protein